MVGVRLTSFEVARIVGLRSLQLSEGHATPLVEVDVGLQTDFVYVATLELFHRATDMKILRTDGQSFHVRDAMLPACVTTLLDSRDGKSRFENAGSGLRIM